MKTRQIISILYLASSRRYNVGHASQTCPPIAPWSISLGGELHLQRSVGLHRYRNDIPAVTIHTVDEVQQEYSQPVDGNPARTSSSWPQFSTMSTSGRWSRSHHRGLNHAEARRGLFIVFCKCAGCSVERVMRYGNRISI